MLLASRLSPSTQNAFHATVMDLARRGYGAFDSQGKNFNMRHDLNKDTGELLPFEAQVLDYLGRAARERGGEDPSYLDKELKRYSEKHLSSFLNGWQGFKRTLSDYSRMNDAPKDFFRLWDRYYCYAATLGVAERYLRNLQRAAPMRHLDEGALAGCAAWMGSDISSSRSLVGVASAASSLSSALNEAGVSASSGGSVSGGGGAVQVAAPVAAGAVSAFTNGYAESVLHAEKLSKIYRDPSGEVVALKDFNHSFPAGEVTAIMGPSGSGKTTLLNLLAGLDVPSSGEVRFDGETISALPERARAEVRLRRFGFIFQSYNLIAVLNAWQNVAFPMGLAGVGARERQERARALLERFGLAGRAHYPPHKLSGGERQRVSVARALANDPAVLFADEPTGNLDSKSGRVVVAALREAAQEGRTVVLVTHDLRLIDEVDSVLELADGTLQGVRRPDPASQPVTA